MPAQSRVDRAWLGLNPLACRLIAAQVCCVLLTAPLYSQRGLSFDWRSGVLFFSCDAAILLLWVYLFQTPGKRRDWIVTETIFAFLLTVVLSHILAPAQYLATAFRAPLIDPFLARADALVGVHVPALTSWTQGHWVVNLILTRAYATLLWRFLLIIPLLGLALQDRKRLWEYVFHFHFCAIVTVLALAVIPAACAFQYYGFDSSLDQTRFIRHFNGLRDGTFTLIRFDNLEGLISMPSFHVAGAMIVTWACRGRWLLVPLGILNAVLVISTFMTGAHYFIDVVLTLPLVALSIAIYRTVVEPRWSVAPVRARSADASPVVAGA